jgi:hypothetical protein
VETWLAALNLSSDFRQRPGVTWHRLLLLVGNVVLSRITDRIDSAVTAGFFGSPQIGNAPRQPFGGSKPGAIHPMRSIHATDGLNTI